ncbi:MAG: ATP-binding protein [Chloroflexota bacterium]
MANTFFSRPVFSDQEFSELLNTIDKAALLIDKNEHRILAVNRQTIELTSYTRSELESMDSRDLFGLDKGESPSFNYLDKHLIHKEIIARYNQRIAISALAKSLGLDSSLVLILFEKEETLTQRQFKQEGLAKLLTYPKHITKALLNEDPNESLGLALESVQDYFPNCELAIYIGNAKQPGIKKIAYNGKDSTFPLEIFPPDLNHFLKPSQWLKGQRSVSTLLHQRARTAGLQFFTATPINEEQSWIGFVVVGGYDGTLLENIQLRLNILVPIVSVVIQNNITRTNLRNRMAENLQELGVWQVAWDTIKDGVITVTTDSTIVRINPAAELTLGYASSEIEGQPLENVFIGTDRLVPAINKAFDGTSTPNLGAINLHRRDGSTFPAHVSVHPVAKNGIVSGILLILRDKSEREQIRLRTQQLEQQALLGEVTSVFAHEVRNPINNISMGLQLLEQTIIDDKKNQERVTGMQEDCRRLTGLMESVLTFSRTGTYHFNSIQVDQLIDRLLNRWRPRLKRVNINYHSKTADNLPPIWGDQRSLEQVFTNIISNAVNAMKVSGGTLAIKLSHKSSHPSKPVIQIDISDTGPGIPENDQQRIFDPFFTTNPDGTGLGLAITKQIITAHRGNITLTSFPGGTVFHIQLPIKPDTEE